MTGAAATPSSVWAVPAKINLTLRVRGRLANGYHALESLVAFADIGERLHVAPAMAEMAIAGTALQFSVTGPMAAQLDTQGQGADNLVLRAVRALEAHCGRALPVDIKLDKHIPVAAGLGGGSADAAACLRAVATLYELSLPADEISDLAANLGADVPVCLSSQPAFMTDTGTQIRRLPDLPALDIVLVNPRAALSTAQVFAALGADSVLQPAASPPDRFADSSELCRYLASVGNDLSDAAQNLVPEIGQCLDGLARLDVLYAAMSGSGASCFALVPSGAGAACAADYSAMHDRHWCMSGALVNGGGG
jgi:4-diphosphocytidyl-2-C-methyl-D-erythritol kinase